MFNEYEGHRSPYLQSCIDNVTSFYLWVNREDIVILYCINPLIVYADGYYLVGYVNDKDGMIRFDDLESAKNYYILKYVC